MKQRRTHRYGGARGKKHTTQQWATIIALVAMLVFVLMFKDALARSVSTLMGAVTSDSEPLHGQDGPGEPKAPTPHSESTP